MCVIKLVLFSKLSKNVKTITMSISRKLMIRWNLGQVTVDNGDWVFLVLDSDKDMQILIVEFIIKLQMAELILLATISEQNPKTCNINLSNKIK